MPHFRNFHGTSYDFAPAEPTKAITDSFVFIDQGSPTLPDDGFDTLIPANLPDPSPATTAIFEEDRFIDVTIDPMADDIFLF